VNVSRGANSYGSPSLLTTQTRDHHNALPASITELVCNSETYQHQKHKHTFINLSHLLYSQCFDLQGKLHIHTFRVPLTNFTVAKPEYPTPITPKLATEHNTQPVLSIFHSLSIIFELMLFNLFLGLPSLRFLRTISSKFSVRSLCSL